MFHSMLTYKNMGIILGGSIGYSYGYLYSKYHNLSRSTNEILYYGKKEYEIYYLIWGIIIGGGSGKLIEYFLLK